MELAKSIFIQRPKRVIFNFQSLKQRMKRNKSRALYKNKNKSKNKSIRRQSGAGGCWGGICSTNKPNVNETAHNSPPLPPLSPFKENNIQMVRNPMFKTATVAEERVYTPRTPEGQSPENAPNPIASLTWLWKTAEYRFTTKYPRKYHDFNFTQGQAIDYLHGNRDILRKAAYNNVIFVLKLGFLNNKLLQEFLERASSDIESLSQPELDYLNNLIIKEYKKAQIKKLKEEVLEDFKTTCYTYNASIIEPANKPYTEELTNLFEQLVVSRARALLTRFERDLQPAGTNVADLVENRLMRIRSTVKNSVGISSLRGGRSRKNSSRKTRKNKQRGSGGCFGLSCSKNNTGVNENAHRRPTTEPVRFTDNPIVTRLKAIDKERAKLMNLVLEQANLQGKESMGKITVKEQEQLNALKVQNLQSKMEELVKEQTELMSKMQAYSKVVRDM